MNGAHRPGEDRASNSGIDDCAPPQAGSKADLVSQDQSMIRKSVQRFSLATNAQRLRGDHAQTKS